MNLVSKLKKISICSLLSVGTLMSSANVGLSAMYPSNAMNNIPGNIDEDTTMDVEEDVPSSNSAPASQQHDQQPKPAYTFGQQSVPTFTFGTSSKPAPAFTSDQQSKPAFTFGCPSESQPESFTFGQQSVPTFTFGKSSKPAPAFTSGHQSFTQSFQSVIDKINSMVSDIEREINLSKEEKIDLLNKFGSLIIKGEPPENAPKKLGISEGLLGNLMRNEIERIKSLSNEEKANLINQWFLLVSKGESNEAAAKKLGVSTFLLRSLFTDEDSHITKI